eukprot:3217505-Prymnesium_polylepis.1
MPPRPRASSSASSGAGIGVRPPRRSAVHSDSSLPAAVRAAVGGGEAHSKRPLLSCQQHTP